MPTGICPDCDGDVQIGPDLTTSDVVVCEDCGVDLEIVGLDPLEFDVVFEDDPDDEDDEDY